MAAGFGRHGMPPPASNPDLLTLKLVCAVCESHLRWRTFCPNLGTLGLCVPELFAMYETDEQTDRQTDRRTKTMVLEAEAEVEVEAKITPPVGYS